MIAIKVCQWLAVVFFALGAIIPLARGGEPNWISAGLCCWAIAFALKG